MQRRNDTGGAPTPIVAAENGAYDLEGVHQRQKVGPKRRLLARARGLRLKETRRPVAAQVGNDHPRPQPAQGLAPSDHRHAGRKGSHGQGYRPAGSRSVFQVADGKNAGPDRFGGCRQMSFASLRVRLARAGSLAIGEPRRAGNGCPGSDRCEIDCVNGGVLRGSGCRSSNHRRTPCRFLACPVILSGPRGASRLLAAQTPNIEAARRRDALARWRNAMAQGLSSQQGAEAVGVPRSTLYRWLGRADP